MADTSPYTGFSLRANVENGEINSTALNAVVRKIDSSQQWNHFCSEKKTTFNDEGTIIGTEEKFKLADRFSILTESANE